MNTEMVIHIKTLIWVFLAAVIFCAGLYSLSYMLEACFIFHYVCSMNFISDLIYGELNNYISKLSKDKDEINTKRMNVDYLFGYVFNF
jgi:hypothetical protein